MVDNNSTDGSAEIAARYPFVTLLRQPIQGSVPARNLGFQHAHGDILARLNADVMLEPGWVTEVERMFASNKKLGGLSGLAITRSLDYVDAPRSTFWTRMYFWWTDAYFRLPQMWGADMAMRREAWLGVEPLACPNNTEVHEDQDLSLLLSAAGWGVAHDNHLRVRTKGQAYHNWPQFWEYMRRRWRTKRYHQRRGTYERARQFVMPRWHQAGVYALIFVPGSIYIISSFLLGLPGIIWRGLRRLARRFGLPPAI